jgi:hypothetical protein
LNHSEPADRHVSEPVSVADGGAGAADVVGDVGILGAGAADVVGDVGILGSCGAAFD